MKLPQGGCSNHLTAPPSSQADKLLPLDKRMLRPTGPLLPPHSKVEKLLGKHQWLLPSEDGGARFTVWIETEGTLLS